jgi:hypothetical protein
MEWLTSNGEVYHRECATWTASAASGECAGCAKPIPETIVRLAAAHAEERARTARTKDVGRSLKAIRKQFEAVEARTSATLKPATDPSKTGSRYRVLPEPSV